MLSQITHPAIDNYSRGAELLGPERHQAPVDGVYLGRGLGDEDNAGWGDLVDLESS